MVWPRELALTAKKKKKPFAHPSNHWLTISHMSLQIRKIFPTFHRPFLLVFLLNTCDFLALSRYPEQPDLVGPAWVREILCWSQSERVIHEQD